MTNKTVLWGVPMLLALSGCASDDAPEPADGIIIDAPKPQNGVQLVTPTFTVEGGSEVFMCMRIPAEVPETMYVQQSVAYQAKGGHHSMLYYLPQDFYVEDAPHECQGSEMGRGGLRFVGVGTADGGGIELPPGVVLEIPAGVKLFTQSHYVNTGTEAVTAQDVINLELVDRSQVTNIAGAYTEIDLSFEIPPGSAEYTRTIDCSPPVDMNVPFMIPHMHEHGKHISVELEQAGQISSIYDSDWDVALRDDFPVRQFAEHLHMTTADRLRTTCTWQSQEETAPLLFPNEMCATFMIFYPSSDGAMWACDETRGNFLP
jgi:hypothetical protein